VGRGYPFLVASLDSVAYDPVQKGMNLRDTFRFIHGQLDNESRDTFRRLFLFNDIKNIVYMHFRTKVRQGDYLYPAYYIEEHYKEVRADPVRAFGFIRRWWDLKNDGIRHLPNLPETDVLTTFFYEDLASVIAPPFMRDWYLFELELRNFTVALALESGHTELQGFAVKDKLIPFGQVYEEICQGALAGRDVGKNMHWPDRIREEQGNLRRAELVCDEVRWNWLDEQLGAEMDGIDVIYAHMIRLWSVERWEELTRRSGEARFNSIVDTMRRSIRFAVEFAGAGQK
jgi:hypothetical protein